MQNATWFGRLFIGHKNGYVKAANGEFSCHPIHFILGTTLDPWKPRLGK
jgi:hypothetical protein